MASTPRSSVAQPRTICIPRFDAAFLERRMREHREQQQAIAAQQVSGIISEVVEAVNLAQELRAGRARHRRLA